ncbi:MAG: hypothetical protein ACRDP1_05680 [Nocardioidaceae bacterium]
MSISVKRTTRRIAFVGVTSAALLGAGVALAAWTTSGDGTGTATAVTSKPLTVAVSNVSGLYPTGSVTVPFTVTNPNGYNVTLAMVSLKSVTVDAAHSTAGCLPSVVTGADLPDTDVIASGATSASRNFSVTMSNAATDGCQGATFTVTLTATGASS